MWSASPAPWCSQQTKETDRNIIHNDYRILTDVATICGCYFSLFSIQFEFSFSPGIISFGEFFKDSIFYELACQSHRLRDENARVQERSLVVIQMSTTTK